LPAGRRLFRKDSLPQPGAVDGVRGARGTDRLRPGDAGEGGDRDVADADQCDVGAGRGLPETLELDLQVAARPSLLSAEPETMRCFLFNVRDKFGSIPEYIEQLGVASAIDYIRGVLVEPSVQAPGGSRCRSPARAACQ
jgi:hypothetical protein